MTALDTNVLISACDKSDPPRQQIALDLIAGATDGTINALVEMLARAGVRLDIVALQASA